MKVVIGDIHGCFKTLEALIKKLPKEVDEIFTVGDLIDRGPNVKEVVQFCIDNNVKSVRGNHEDMFLDFLGYSDDYDEGKYPSEKNGGEATIRSYDNGIFEMNGGETTIKQYGGNAFKIKSMYGDEYCSSPCNIPDSHLEYFKNMPIFIETDDFVISHAGVHPIYVDGEYCQGKWNDGSDKANQSLMWNRNGVANIGKFQIFGHTPNKDVTPVIKWNALKEEDEMIGINIDTGGYYANRGFGILSAIVMPSGEIIQQQYIG